MTSKDLIKGLEEYKRKTDLFPRTEQGKKVPVRLVRKNRKIKQSFCQKTKV